MGSLVLTRWFLANIQQKTWLFEKISKKWSKKMIQKWSKNDLINDKKWLKIRPPRCRKEDLRFQVLLGKDLRFNPSWLADPRLNFLVDADWLKGEDLLPRNTGKKNLRPREKDSFSTTIWPFGIDKSLFGRKLSLLFREPIFLSISDPDLRFMER